MNKKKEITGVFAGNLRKAHRLGCQFALRSSMVETKGPYDLVITSNSGYPLDLNIYQSVKGICAAAQIVKPGGTILMASECGDGIPRGSDYDKILQQVEDPGQLGAFLSRQELKYGDTWQVYMQALVQQKVKVGFYSDRLTPSTIRQALFEPVQNLDEAIREIVREAGSDIKICILPEGPQTIPYLPLS
jgi:nickel-dependent lactate racemase